MQSRRPDSYPTVEQVLSDADSRMGKAVKAFQQDLLTLRSGRATPALVEGVMVDYYGTPMPLQQLASISAPEARLIVIQPWDRQAIPNIEKALRASELSLNPSNDGTLIRVPVPPLSEERRRELVRLLHRKTEDAKVAVRNVRRDALDKMRDMERNKVVSQDEVRRAQDQLQKLTDAHIAEIDSITRGKEAEILQV